jgi:WD40 repeat protein
MRTSLIIFLILFNVKTWAQENDIFIDKFTSINPVSYTDVIFIGTKDTVLVATFSGRISKIINGKNKENVIAQIDDEIYALAYNKNKKEIIAATLENGIIIINERTGEIVKKIPLNSSWAIAIVSSETNKYIATQDQKGNRYIFDIQNDYTNINDGFIPSGRVVAINQNNIATIVTSKKVALWDLLKKQIVKEWDIELKRYEDMDSNGDFLSINFNECLKYDANSKAIEFKIKHPNWLLPNPENLTETFEIPLQMQLNAARFAKNYIYTAGIDRSVRVWNKNTGEYITTLIGHKGSISKMKVSDDETQVVSIDLKGVIKFWEVE